MAATEEDDDLRAALSSVRGTGRIWLLVFLTAAVGAYGVYHQRGDVAEMRQEVAESDARATEKQAELIGLVTVRKELDSRIAELSQENAALLAFKAKLERDNQIREAAVVRQQALKKTLMDKLQVQLDTSQASVGIEEDRLRIELTEELLFANPTDTLTDNGRAVLTKIAEALTSTSADNMRIEVAARWDGGPLPAKTPSVWALSTARASAVCTALNGSGKLPALRIDVTSRGAPARDRRVEILIHPPPPPPETNPPVSPGAAN